VEHFAQIALVTHLLGTQQPLGERDVEKLMAVRSKYQGIRSTVGLSWGAASTGNDEGHKSQKSGGSQQVPRSSLRKG
jgi:hypothetical protein